MKLSDKLNKAISDYNPTPRTMVHDDSKSEFKVYFWIMLKNGWEYYIDKPNKDGIAFGYVMGFENEWGSVDVNEIQPYVWSLAMGEDEIPQPAPSYHWAKMNKAELFEAELNG